MCVCRQVAQFAALRAGARLDRQRLLADADNASDAVEEAAMVLRDATHLTNVSTQVRPHLARVGCRRTRHASQLLHCDAGCPCIAAVQCTMHCIRIAVLLFLPLYVADAIHANMQVAGKRPVQGAAISPDNATLATADWNGIVAFWALDNDISQIRSFQVHPNFDRCVQADNVRTDSCKVHAVLRLQPLRPT